MQVRQVCLREQLLSCQGLKVNISSWGQIIHIGAIEKHTINNAAYQLCVEEEKERER